MSSQNPYNLPLDIFTEIVAHLDDTQAQTKVLRSLSLVSRNLLGFARSYLFREFDMRKYRCDLADDHFYKFYLCLSQSPDLRQYVRTVHLYNISLWDHDRHLAVFISLLSKVEAFALCYASLNCWTDQRDAVRIAIENLCRSTSLNGLSISKIKLIPINLLTTCCRNLRNLHLQDTTFDVPITYLPRAFIHRDGLSDVRLTGISTSDLEILLSDPVNMTGVSYLTIDFTSENVGEVSRVISRAHSRLTLLEIGQLFESYHLSYKAISLIKLNSLTNLRFLSITMLMPRHTPTYSSCNPIVSNWCKVLCTVSKSLQKITVFLDFSTSALEPLSPGLIFYRYVYMPHPKYHLLTQLDKALSDCERFPDLCYVQIVVQIPEYPWNMGSYPSEMENLISKSLDSMMQLTRSRFAKDGRGTLRELIERTPDAYMEFP